MAIGGHWEETLHRFTLGRMDTLLLGALAALAFRDEGQKALWARLVRPAAAASGLVFAGVVVATLYFRPSFSLYYTVGSSAIAAFYACLVFWSATSGSNNPILCSNPMRTLGKYSYGIYVLHVLFFYYIRDGMSRATLGDRLLNIAVNVATTGVLAYISWVAIERPALSLKRYFEYDPPGLPESVAVAEPSAESADPLTLHDVRPVPASDGRG
jgi:peptidoglycan/LPS O-acetylase OafA/YrhL